MWTKRKGGIARIKEDADSFVSELLNEDWARGDSPIEKLFFIGLRAQVAFAWPYLLFTEFDETEDFSECVKHDRRTSQVSLVVWPQAKIGDFRVDFLISATAVDGRLVQAVVECDGHDFHERTKEQASKDKARDRRLQMSGFPVYRYSGSDLWRDPCGCARQVLVWIDNQIFVTTK